MPAHADLVFVNGRFLGQRITGVQRYAREILMAMDDLLFDRASWPFRVVLLIPPGVSSPEFSNIEVRTVGRGGGHRWEQTYLPWHARSGFLLSLGSTGPFLRGHQAVTIHDAAVFAVPDSYGVKFRTWYQLSSYVMLRRNPVTMTVSEFSAQELSKRASVDRRRLRVSGEGWEHARRVESDVSILSSLRVSPGQYLLAVGSRTRHKNLEVVAQALALLDDNGSADSIKLVLAGGSDPKVFGGDEAPNSRSLVPAGYVTDEALRALYENAAAFIFPSKYEGFGLPPLEAMALGCPVICARAASMPEVCRDAVIYFDPDDPAELAKAMIRLNESEELRQSLRERAETVLHHHSWTAAAEAHLKMISSFHGR